LDGVLESVAFERSNVRFADIYDDEDIVDSGGRSIASSVIEGH
jgi:hypothetical protein